MIKGILTLLQMSFPTEKHWRYSNAVFVKQGKGIPAQVQEALWVPGS
jgi:hypothetical protein